MQTRHTSAGFVAQLGILLAQASPPFPVSSYPAGTRGHRPPERPRGEGRNARPRSALGLAGRRQGDGPQGDNKHSVRAHSTGFESQLCPWPTNEMGGSLRPSSAPGHERPPLRRRPGAPGTRAARLQRQLPSPGEGGRPLTCLKVLVRK